MHFTQIYSKKINIDSNDDIYFINCYYPKHVKDSLLAHNIEIDYKDSQRILDFKNGNEGGYGYYYTCLSAHFKEFEGMDWIICSVPSHNQIEENKPNMIDFFLMDIKLPSNIKFELGLILRNKEMPKKHGSDVNYGARTIDKDLESYTGKTPRIIDKNIIVLDDITTSGASLEAARQFLYKRGANKVVCIAFARTTYNGIPIKK